MYEVNRAKFESFTAAIGAARAVGADVIEVATGLRRWTPGAVKARTRHVIVNADGTKTEFSKIRR